MRMAQPALEHWVCTENITQYRLRLQDPAEEVHHDQIEGLLARELAKLQAMFPD
jgi:hypothetical protein